VHVITHTLNSVPMASYLRNWLRVGASTPEPTTATNSPAQITLEISPLPSDDEDQLQDDDFPPAFPSLSSAQRVSGTASGLPRVLTDFELMRPPPIPSLADRKPPGVKPTPGSLTVPATTRPMPKRKGKVGLAPGHSPLDWANLKASGVNLRGIDPGTLLRVTPSELKMHNKRDDAWAAFCGRVYNITPYLSFHPGGETQLMRAAGRDGTKLFMATHSWVNLEFMLDACLIGFLVSEPSNS